MEYYELSYILMVISLLITLVAQLFVMGSYAKYKKIKNKKGLTGAEVAREILNEHGLGNIYVTETRGYLSDHYDPTRKVIRLSKDIYNGTSIASVSVAAHEVGHAIQDKEGYSFMRFRSAIFPIVNLASKGGYFAILIGLIFGFVNLIWIGIGLEIVILLFQLVTLPVEFDASARAAKEIEKNEFLDKSERTSSKNMLNAAAFTYVASVLTSLIEIFRLILIARSDN